MNNVRSTMYRMRSVSLALLLALGGLASATTLIIGTTAEVSGLDPRIATDIPSFERISVLMEPLVVFSNDLGLEPRLASSWELADDGLSLSFSLEEGILFHHGREFTSEDVKYTFDWVLDADNSAPNRPLYTDIIAIDTPDPYTVIFNLSEPNSFLLNNIARMPIVPADLGDDPAFADNPVGTGPMAFVSLARDDRMVVEAFEDYWGGRALIDRAEFRTIPEDATRLLAFEGGEIDLFQGGMVPNELARLEEDDAFVVQRAPGTGYTYLGLNLESPPLDNVLVRQAISHVIPREAIVERILEGIGEPGISMLSPDMPWFNPDVRRFDYNIEAARELLAEAGYEDGDIVLRLYTNENPVRMQIAEILQAELARIGITLEVNIEEFGAFLSRVQTTSDFDMFILGWGGQLDPDRAMIRQFTTEGSANYVNYSNPEVDELVQSGRLIAPDTQESIDIYQAAQVIIVEEVPYAFINYTEEIAVHQPYIENWQVHPYSAVTYQNIHLIAKNR